MSTVAGALLVGVMPVSIPLDPIGAQSCTLLTDGGITSIPFSVTGLTGTVSLGTTFNSNFVGTSLVTQGAFIAPGTTNLGVVTSDRATLTYGDTAPIVIRADGANNFNSDPTTGFWTVTNTGPLDITNVQFSWVGSSTPNNLFDTDQTGMADRFDGGNSTAVGCGGTYRNGSDVATGLVYAGTAVSPCDPAGLTGWTGSNPGTGTSTFSTLDFAFASFGQGDVFEVDIDTDGGTTSGGAMAGMNVTVTFIGGTTRTGQLQMVSATESVLIL